MKIWYRDDLVTLYQGDCMEYLSGIPDNSTDLVITDPPYGMSYKSNHYKRGNPFGGIQGDESFPIEAVEQIRRVTRNAALVFCRWDNLRSLPPPKSFLVWEKNNWTAGDLKHGYARKWEGIAFYPGPRHSWAKGRPNDVIHCPRVPPRSLIHPTQKPLDLIRELIGQHTGEVVLDPFCGSGTTLLAAKQLGRRAIGIELDKRYCEITAKRLRDFTVNTKRAA